MSNFDKTQTFEGGYSKDITDNIERKNTFDKGVNGRLYSKNGAFSFSSIEGSKLIYNNDKIVKYLGSYSFSDEFIVFAKCLKTESGNPLEEETCELNIDSNSFEITADTAESNVINITSQFGDNSNETELCYTTIVPVVDPTEFEIPFDDNVASENVDLSEYYRESYVVQGIASCTINNAVVPPNNKEYYDCIYSFSFDDNQNLVAKRLWVGTQNWPLNGRITCEGVEENDFYKRVYYTDAVNTRRVVNIKDKSLYSRSGNDFNQVLENTLLQPEIESVTTGGQLKSMKVLYVYRVISENGQLSGFSPGSKLVYILPESEANEFKGGDPNENTYKSVNVKINVVDPVISSEIECYAIEYESFGIISGIKSIGKKKVDNVVRFSHLGNESQWAENVNFNEIVQFTNTWKYCNDFTSKKNRLIAAGLRNEAISSQIQDLEYLMPLHAWNDTGGTFTSIYSPRPWEYRYIDPKMEGQMTYIKKKVYRKLAIFGDGEITFRNVATGSYRTLILTGLSLSSYTDVSQQIYDWLIDDQANNPDFNATWFPNLKIEISNGQILLSPQDGNIQTDMSNYIFESNNDQFIQEVDRDLQFLYPGIDGNRFVWGAQSIGFSQGTGIRITFREESVPLLNQAWGPYTGGKVLDYHTPNLEKYFMKGEIYRLAFQAFGKDGSPLFAIPLGDIQVPAVGDQVRFIDDAGNPYITNRQYANQYVSNGILYGVGLKMHVEVRLSCDLQEQISMYQILHVHREENDRTILCQGIAAPLERVVDTGSSEHRLPDALRNNWTLPYYGGPTYDYRAFWSFDSKGENTADTWAGPPDRVLQHRKLMYFDSPDLYYDQVSDTDIANSTAHIIGKLNTDHTPGIARVQGGYRNAHEAYPKFSRKIIHNLIEGDNNTGNFPRHDLGEGENGTDEYHFINVSVYSKFRHHNENKSISHARNLNKGEVISGQAFGMTYPVSNNAFCLPSQPWYYGRRQRDFGYKNDDSGKPKYTTFGKGMTSIGEKTTIIRTDDNLFTDDFLGPLLPPFDNEIRLGGWDHVNHYDTIALINIIKDNRESIFGGRTRQAFLKNVYTPLSKTIPVLKKNTAIQYFDVGGDTFMSLNIRNKNGFGNDPIVDYAIKNDDSGLQRKGGWTGWRRNGAWTYAVVLETQVETKLDSQYKFYRDNSGSLSFENIIESINGAYFTKNDLKRYIPRPSNFKDDPDLGNVIAISDIKLSGQSRDAWVNFRPNNFYAELEKNKGDVSNIIKHKDEIWAIQEQQSSMILIGVERMVNDSDGNPINIQQGSGTAVDGHKVMSRYGTLIRGSVVENEDHGFSFFDERNVEFVKLINPLLKANFLHFYYWELFKNNPVTDAFAFYDHKNEETNIRLRTKNGNSHLISFNEKKEIKKFNGEFDYDNDMYITFNNRLFSPITTNEGGNPLSEKLHELNEGDSLNIFENQKEMKLGFFVNASQVGGHTSSLNKEKVIQYKMFSAICNLPYNVKSVFFKSNLGYDRTILGTHEAYKIREGVHTVPAINETNDFFNVSDVRGSWVYVEMTIESLNQNKIDILAVINSLRLSHQ